MPPTNYDLQYPKTMSRRRASGAPVGRKTKKAKIVSPTDTMMLSLAVQPDQLMLSFPSPTLPPSPKIRIITSTAPPSSKIKSPMAPLTNQLTTLVSSNNITLLKAKRNIKSQTAKPKNKVTSSAAKLKYKMSSSVLKNKVKACKAKPKLNAKVAKGKAEVKSSVKKPNNKVLTSPMAQVNNSIKSPVAELTKRKALLSSPKKVTNKTMIPVPKQKYKLNASKQKSKLNSTVAKSKKKVRSSKAKPHAIGRSSKAKPRNTRTSLKARPINQRNTRTSIMARSVEKTKLSLVLGAEAKSKPTLTHKITSAVTKKVESLVSFGCPLCHMLIGSADDVRRHMECHSGQSVYQCPRCALLFSERSEYDDHVGNQIYEDSCQISNASRAACEIKLEVNCSCEDNTPELLHSKVYEQKLQLETKTRPVMGSISTFVQLGQCRAEYTSVGLTAYRADIEKEIIKINQRKPSEGLKVDMRNCTLCGTWVKLSRLPIHMHKHLRGHKCFICGKYSQKIKQMQEHFSSLQWKRSCPYCKVSCHGLKMLRSHVAYKHPTQTPLTCSECDGLVHDHHKLKHHACQPGRMDYRCCHCSQNFKHFSELREHLSNLYSGEVIICLMCGVYFPTHRDLVDHVKMFHRQPIWCPHCGVKGEPKAGRVPSTYSCALTTEVQQCTSCGGKFDADVNLKQHKANVTGQAPSDCGMCVKGFLQEQDLVDHLKAHGLLKANVDNGVKYSLVGQ